MTRLRLSLLGPFRLEADAEIALPSRKAQALLAYLALPAGRPHRRDKLASLLWADRGDTAARHNLRMALSQIAKAIRPGAKNGAAIVAAGDKIAVDPAAFDVDAAQLERLVADGSPEALLNAVALCHGDLLDGLNLQAEPFEEWLTAQRSRFRELAVQAHRLLLDRQIAWDGAEAAIITALRLLAFDATDEDAHRKLMRLYLAQGRKDAALRQFQICADTLQRELGLAPDAETRALHRSIAQARTNADLPHASAANRRRDLAPQSGPRAPVDAAPAETRHVSARPAIAVLPFANVSGDAEQEYFADGLTEDIITDLSRVSALFVVARNTVFTYKGRAVEVRQAARELNVDRILEGSVRKAGDRLRISVQLVDGRSGGHLWADRYDRSMDDIFALQDEISQSVVAALKVTLLPEERARMASRSTTSPEAYQYYLMGRSFFLRSGWGERALRVARQMFARAAEIDPQYARSYSGIANSDCYLMCMGDPAVSYQDILSNSERALALDPALAEAHATKGLALYTAGRHREATVALDQALRLGPDLFEAHFFAARNFRAQGRYRECIPLFERAAELQPDDFRALGLVVNAYRSLADRDGMRSAARRCLERVEAEVAAHPGNAGALAFGAIMLTELGDLARAEAWAARAAGLDPLDSITSYNLACAYVAMGKLKTAMERLERVYADPPFRHRAHVEWMKKDSSLEPLHDYPPYQALVARLDAEVAQDSQLHVAGQRPAIAVLPFDNLSGDPEQEYFADGLTEDILTDLARVSTLFVVARNTVFTLKGQAVRIPQAARELNVGYVLEGSVRKVGARVRITAQLVDGRSGGHLWAQRYDRPLDDIFGLQDEISRSIVEALKGQLEPGAPTTPATRPATNPDAYEYYLKGRSFFLRGLWGRRTLTVARQMFAKSAESDPTYARAYAGQAYCECYLLWLGDPSASLEAAANSIARGFELAPDAPELQAAKGLVLWAAGRYGEAEEPFQQALALGPSLFEAHLFAGRNCRVRDQHERAAGLFERAADLQPNDFKSLGLAADAYRSLGRREDMLSAARRSAERIEVEVGEHPDNAHALAFGAVLLAELGDDGRAEDWAQRAIAIDPSDPTLKYNLACTYAALARPALALDWLQKIAAESPASRRWLGAWMSHDSALDPLRNHPRFRSLAQALADGAAAIQHPVV